jgi:hypothetical protein
MERINGGPRNAEGGFAVSSEVLLIAVILVCGLITGWVKLRDQSMAEVKDTMAAIDQWVTGTASALQPYAQPWITAGVVASTAVAPVTEEYPGPPCVATSGGPVVCPAPGASIPGGTLTLSYGPNPTAATSGNPASFEVNTTF